MDENGIENLQETPFERDCYKTLITATCNMYNQIKLRHIHSNSNFTAFWGADSCNLACSYRLKEKLFLFSELRFDVINRFIALLASLTLQHFCFVSKEMYYRCLDLRGLEYYFLDLSKGYTRIYGYTGMKIGIVKNNNFARYVLCYCSLLIDFSKNPDLDKLYFIKKYKTLKMGFVEDGFEENMIQYCEILFHPGLENVTVFFKRRNNTEARISLQKLEKLLEYCKNVVTLLILFEKKSIIIRDDPDISIIKDVFEAFAEQAPNLETLLFLYGLNFFQIRDKKLKKVIKKAEKWYLSDDCRTDTRIPLNSFNECVNKHNKLPFYIFCGYYDNVLRSLMCRKRTRRTFWG